MKMNDFSDLGNIIDKFTKGKEKVASIVIPDDSPVQERISLITKNVINSAQSTESEKIAAVEFKKEIEGSLAEKVASINRQKEEFLLKLSEKMGESYARGVKKVAGENVPLDMIAQNAEAASNAVQLPPEQMIPPGLDPSSALIPEGGDQKTIEEVKDTAAAAVAAVASTLAEVAEAKGAGEGQAPPVLPPMDAAAIPQMPPPDMGGILPSDMGQKVASKLTPTEEEKGSEKLSKLAQGLADEYASAEGAPESEPALSDEIGNEESLAQALLIADQIVEGMRKDEEGKVTPPPTAIGESVDDKLKDQLVESILSGEFSGGADEAAAPGSGEIPPEAAAGIPPEMAAAEPPMEEGGGDDELAAALAGEGEDEGGEEYPDVSEALTEDEAVNPEISNLEETVPEVEPGDEGDVAAAAEGEEAKEDEAEEAAGGESGEEEIDPATLALLEEQANGAPEEGVDGENPEVMAAAAEVAQRMAEEESKKRGVI